MRTNGVHVPPFVGPACPILLKVSHISQGRKVHVFYAMLFNLLRKSLRHLPDRTLSRRVRANAHSWEIHCACVLESNSSRMVTRRVRLQDTRWISHFMCLFFGYSVYGFVVWL